MIREYWQKDENDAFYLHCQTAGVNIFGGVFQLDKNDFKKAKIYQII